MNVVGRPAITRPTAEPAKSVGMCHPPVAEFNSRVWDLRSLPQVLGGDQSVVAGEVDSPPPETSKQPFDPVRATSVYAARSRSLLP
jgi:hypothetical protein